MFISWYLPIHLYFLSIKFVSYSIIPVISGSIFTFCFVFFLVICHILLLLLLCMLSNVWLCMIGYTFACYIVKYLGFFVFFSRMLSFWLFFFCVLLCLFCFPPVQQAVNLLMKQLIPLRFIFRFGYCGYNSFYFRTDQPYS